MKHTIHYTQPTRAEREAAALEDAREYLGEHFDEMMEYLREFIREYPTFTIARLFDQLTLALSFTGIEGLPARAMIREAINTH